MNWRDWCRAAVREPLGHFLVGGALVFVFFAWRGEQVDPESRRIVITKDAVGQLAAQFEQTMQRQPTPPEMDGLIRDEIREEVYYREAKRLGLDADDVIIRRRLHSKMEYLARAEAEAAVPDDATLQTWLDNNAARYASSALYSFDQIFLGDADDAAARTALAKRADWRTLGKSLSVPSSTEKADKAEISRTFGTSFADALAGQKQGVWVGPLASGFGNHLVRIRAVAVPHPPKLADVRQRVENDWRAATVAQREAKAYQALLDGYDIKIEKP